MPRISIADLEDIIENEEEFEDRRERCREKEAKSRFKENTSEGHDNGKQVQH